MDEGIGRGLELLREFDLKTPSDTDLGRLNDRVGQALEGVDAHPAAIALFAESAVLAEAARERAGAESVGEAQLKDYADALGRFALCIFHP
jgi:hypothetical protein